MMRSVSLALILAVLAACGGDEGGGSSGNPCLEDPEGAACQACSDELDRCYDDGICAEELDEGFTCASENCPGFIDAPETQGDCLRAHCSVEARALRSCMDSMCSAGSACIWLD